MSRKTKAAEFLEEGHKIHVTGRHVLVTEAMKKYATDKVGKIEQFTDRIIDINITMDVQKLEHRCDIVLKVDHIKVKSHGTSTDMYVSIDQAVAKLERQLLKYRGRIRDHAAKRHSAVDLKVNVLRSSMEEELMDVNLEIDEETKKQLVDQYRPHQVVSQKSRPLMTLSEDEAIMKIELSGDVFLAYRSEVDRKLKVIYRQRDEDLAIIELE